MATLKDIARACDVSVATVSNVVTNKAVVHPRTRERVLEAMRRLNYRPHALARNLRTRRSGALGILLPNLMNPVYASIVRGAVRRAEEIGYVMLVADVEAVGLGDRSAARIPTSDLNRFLAELVATRQPPAKQGHRLKLIYMAQIDQSPPRFAVQVNSRNRVTRDYAYFLENRLRERYRLEGVPVIIDFVERGGRRSERRGGRERAPSA